MSQAAWEKDAAAADDDDDDDAPWFFQDFVAI